jgi:hypothetical protein
MNQKPKSILELLPQYILAATGVIYAAGFLIVLTFLDRFGLRETGSDFWKARYIHIGIQALVFPFILNGSIYAIMHLIFHGKFEKSTMWQRIMPVGLLVINLEVVIFVVLMLSNRTPRGTIAGVTPLCWIFAVTLGVLALGLLVQRILEKAFGKNPRSDEELTPAAQAFAVNSRWILVVVIAIMDVWFFMDFREVAGDIQPVLALFYFGLSGLLGVVASTISLYAKRQDTEGRRNAIEIIGWVVCAPLAYLIVLAFSYGVYQNIPSTRGGGNYTLAPKVVLALDSDAAKSKIDDSYFSSTDSVVTIPLVLIEESAWAFYLADPSDGGGPSEWKRIGGRKPKILILNKEDVSSLVSESRNPKKTSP